MLWILAVVVMVGIGYTLFRICTNLKSKRYEVPTRTKKWGICFSIGVVVGAIIIVHLNYEERVLASDRLEVIAQPCSDSQNTDEVLLILRKNEEPLCYYNYAENTVRRLDKSDTVIYKEGIDSPYVIEVNSEKSLRYEIYIPAS